MNRAPASDIYETSLECWRFAGEFLYSTSRKTYLLRVLNFCILLTVLVLISVNFFHLTLEMYINNLKFFLITIHILIKYTLFIYHKDRLGKLLKDRMMFWDYRKFPKKISTGVEHIYKLLKRIQRRAIVFILITYGLHLAAPVFSEGNVYIFDMWTFPDSYGLDAAQLALQYVYFVIASPIVVGYDSIYTSLLVDVAVQVTLLKFTLRSVTFKSKDEAVKLVRSCAKHHQFLLRVLSEMRTMYSVILLFQYIATTLEACAELYVFTLGENGLGNSATNLLTILVWFGQFALYSFLAEIVAYEFSDISRAIYVSTWYKGEVVTQKLMLVMMVKSQQAQYFSGAGLVDINVYSYGSVVRKIFNFYAILRNLMGR